MKGFHKLLMVLNKNFGINDEAITRGLHHVVVIKFLSHWVEKMSHDALAFIDLLALRKEMLILAGFLEYVQVISY